ncbi:HAMP domain-containing protein [Shewanella sp. WXL01]|uniref:sensor histidine kinase n=1 Tax=Shewanella sp. WXL01 TaxID=2709721 RepID=UPI00143857CE|nr:HAMP domain-containing sensor histidine kinase [Shewanella sp. WXL01]NKF50337.1 HAMP domain-containing protein [Shewanella sp. WXL01]
MSIRLFLFAVFAGLIIILGVSQVGLMHYLKAELQTELEQSSKSLSQDIVSVAFKQINREHEQLKQTADELQQLAPKQPHPPKSINTEKQRVIIERKTQQQAVNAEAEAEAEAEAKVKAKAKAQHHAEQQLEQAIALVEQRLGDGFLEGKLLESDVLDGDVLKGLTPEQIADLDIELLHVDDEQVKRVFYDKHTGDINVLVDDISQQVEMQIEELTEQFIAVAAEENDLSEREKQQQMAKLNAQINQQVKQLLKHEKVTLIREKQALIEEQKTAAKAYQQQVEQVVASLTLDTDNWLDDGVVIVKELDDGNQVHSQTFNVQSQGANNALQKFNDSLMLLIIASSVLTLALAYWIAYVVTKPLSHLHQGFAKVGKGEFGAQIKPSGVSELKRILQGFNNMSVKLKDWQNQMQSVTERQHLADIGQVAKGIAHSLRNPLHTIGLLAEQSAFADDVDERQRNAQLVRQKMQVMDKNIQSLLMLANTQVDRSVIIDLNLVLQDILLELTMTAADVKIALANSSQPMLIQGAETEVRAILHAVVVNALEALQSQAQQTQTKQINISSNQQANAWCIQVVDNGPGIDASISDKLFEPHVSSKAEGSGMGLYMAKRLIVSHYQGDIEIHNRDLGGCEVNLCFAINGAINDVSNDVHDDTQQAAQQGES